MADLVTVGAGREELGCLGCTAVAFLETVVATFAVNLLETVGLGTGAPGCLAMPDFIEAAYLVVAECFDTGTFDTTGAPFFTFAYGVGAGALALAAVALAEAAAAAAALSFSRCFLCRWAFKPRRAFRVGGMSVGVHMEHSSGFSQDTR